MTLRPKAIWRFGLPAALAISVIAAVAQGEWSAMLGAIALYGGFGAMAWRWKLELIERRVVVTRLKVREFDLDHLHASIEQVSEIRGFVRHLTLVDPRRPGSRVALLLVWWDGWRALAEEVEAERGRQWG